MRLITWLSKTVVAMAVCMLIVGLSVGAVYAVPSIEISRLTYGNNPNRFIEWNMTADVRAFYDDGVANFGWLLKDRNEEFNGLYQTSWLSKESTSTNCGAPSAPQLHIETSAGTFLVQAPSADASLDENSPNLNRGGETEMRVISRAPHGNWRIVVRFDLPDLPAGTTISRALLRLCLIQISGDNSRRVYEVHRLAMGWEESQVTVNQAAAQAPWDFGALESAIPLAYVQKDVLGADPNVFMNWNVTEDVQAFLFDGVANFGWLLRDRDEGQAGLYQTDWISRENSVEVCGGPSAPQLLLWTGSTADPPTHTLVAVADASLDENSPNAKYGTQPFLRLVSRPSPGNWRSVVRFVLPDNITTLTQATLRLCLDTIGGDKTRAVYEAHRLAMGWEEAEVTVNQAANLVSWDFGALESAIPIAYVQKDVLGNDPNVFITWDVTNDVDDFLFNGVANFGWLLKDQAESSGGQYITEWISKQNSAEVCGGPSAPQLLLWTGPISDPPPPPTHTLVAVADASLDENSPNAKYGTQPLLRIVSWLPLNNWRSVVRFVLPDINTLTRATLRLCLDKISGDKTRAVYEAHRLAIGWDEAQVTVNQAALQVPWDFGALESAIPIAYVQKDVLGNDPNVFISWDVTDDVHAFLDDGVANYGWVLRDQAESSGGLYQTDWISRENSAQVCGGPSHPRLRIETSPGVFLEPDLVAVADASLDENSPNLKRGTESLLRIVSWKPLNNWRSVVRFDLSGLSGVPIYRASMQLCLDKISGDKARGVYEAHRLVREWKEDEVTVNQAKVKTAWDFGALEDEFSVGYVNKGALGNDPNVFVTWDVTDHVQAFVDHEVVNNGWLIKDRKENDPVSYRTDWISRESTSTVCGGPSAPQLLIWTGSLSDPPTHTLVAVADASLDENSPNFNRGTESPLKINSWAPTNNWRSLVRFDLSAISSTTISRATLQLCLDTISGNNSRRLYEARVLTQAWEELQVTPNRAKTGEPWHFFMGAFE